MWDYNFQVTDYGILGTLPTGEEQLFATESEYRQAYEDEENEIYDEMADYYGDRICEYAEF